jgi:hypothetical protein
MTQFLKTVLGRTRQRVGGVGEQAAAFFKIETTQWNRVIQAANLQLD